MPSQPFAALAERHARVLWRFCASQVGVAYADDCFQETMLAALRAYPRLRDDDAALPWLLRIAARKAVDHGRASARRRALDAQLLAEARPVEPGLEERLVDDRLLVLLRQLPEKQRLAVGARVFGELSYREIALLMDTSEVAARQNVHAALKTLRSQEEAPCPTRPASCAPRSPLR